jgi:hypothetical protein
MEFELFKIREVSYANAVFSGNAKKGLKKRDILILPSEQESHERLKRIQTQRTINELKRISSYKK